MKYRFKLAAIHLLISLILVIVSSAFVFLVMYPQPYALATGVLTIFSMLLVIDLILGPLLTFIAATEGKKSLKIDLCIIGFLQLSALIYGLYSISLSRPVYQVFYIDRFELVQLNELIPAKTDNDFKNYLNLSWAGPEYVSVKPPINSEEKTQRMFVEVTKGVDSSLRESLYQDLYNARGQIIGAAKSLDLLQKFNDKNEVSRILMSNRDASYWLPLRASNKDMVVLLDQKYSILKAVDLRPWDLKIQGRR